MSEIETNIMKLLGNEAITPYIKNIIHNLDNWVAEPNTLPHFIIMFGPQGSGKSLFQQEILNHYKLTSYIPTNIDDLVYKSSTYVREYENIKETDDFTLYKNKLEKLKNLLIRNMSYIYKRKFGKNVSEATKKITGAIANNIEKLEDEINNNVTKKDINNIYYNLRKIYDNVNDYILETAIEKKANIIFEIVGSNITKWVYDLLNKVLQNKYKIILVYPYSENYVLRFRYITRAISNGYSLNIPKKEAVDFVRKNFFLLVKHVNVSHIMDNRGLIKHDFSLSGDNQIYYRKNIFECDEGKCVIIDYAQRCKLNYREENLDEATMSELNSLC